eukprot:s783_g3.t1
MLQPASDEAHFLREEIDLVVDRGGASVSENPFNSLHWWTPQEQAMWALGRWWDQRYSARCFGGARAKLQRLRHNLQEIQQWPRADCNHFHDPREWEPWLQDGKRVYPSAEESAYTVLCFAIAVAASWWAVIPGVTLGIMTSVQKCQRKAAWSLAVTAAELPPGFHLFHFRVNGAFALSLFVGQRQPWPAGLPMRM